MTSPSNNIPPQGGVGLPPDLSAIQNLLAGEVLHGPAGRLGDLVASSTVKTYVHAAAFAGGHRTMRATVSWSDVTSSYTFGEGHWRSDTILLGLSPAGMNILEAARKLTSPIDSRQLDKILRVVLLGGCQGESPLLTEILARHPSVRRHYGDLKISVPLTFYHDSGTQKDVYFALCVLLPHSINEALREVGLALKIGKTPDAISAQELQYPHRLLALQNRNVPLSHPLASVDLSAFPELNMPDRVLLIEAFERGKPVGTLLNGPHHLTAGLSVAHCMFTLTKRAIEAGLGYVSTGEDMRNGCLLSASVPLDINPGNFLIDATRHSVLVDVGRYQDPQTFTQILLRIIATYWNYEFTSYRESRHEYHVPLHPLFQEVRKSFGREFGDRLLRECAVELGFMLGVPHEKLAQRFPAVDTRAIGTRLKLQYGFNTESGTEAYVSSQIAFGRHRYWRRLAQLIADGDGAAEMRLRTLPRATPYLVTSRHLRRIADSLDSFLNGEVEFGAPIPGSNARSREARTVRALADRSSHSLPAPKRQGPYGLDYVRFATFFSPFPDPAVISIAVITINMGSENGHFQNTSSRGWLRYQEQILRAGIELRAMFEDRSFTAALADVCGHNIGAWFVREGRRYSHNGRRGEPFRAHLGRWISLLIALHHLYEHHGLKVLQALKPRAQQFLARLQEHNSGDPNEVLRDLYDTVIVGVDSATLQFTPQVIGIIKGGQEALQRIFIRRNFSGPEQTLPSFTSRVEPSDPNGAE